MSSSLLHTERRAIFGLASLYATRMLGLFMVLPVLALYADDLDGATPLLVGMALGGYGLTQAILQIPFGLLSDRFGRKLIISIGLLLFLLGSVVAAQATSIGWVIAGRCLQGSGAVAGAIMALLADQTREEVRTAAMATIGLSIGIAFGVAMVVGPLVADPFGLAGVFWFTAVLAAVGLLVLWRLVPRAPRLVSHRDVGLDRTQLRGMLARRDLLRLDFSIFALHAILTACFVAVPFRLEALGIAAAHHGWVYLPIMALAFVAMVPLVIVAEKYRKMKPIFIGAVAWLTLCLAGLVEFSDGRWALFSLLWGFFVAFNLLEATLPSMISKLAPAGAKGTAMGVYSTSQFLGAFLGGTAGGFLSQHFGLDAVFLGATLLGAVWLAIVWKMPAPRHLSSEIVALDEHSMGTMDTLMERFAAVAGVEDVMVVPDERVAYLKVDRQRLDAEALERVLGSQRDHKSA
ncbi:MFS transporter [Chromohalobacter sp. HP20-39]|uniref:MFS transporter n=1 Tax=Chromohalobacter sp. HP20-39 TaxID=3079306 RepID=UPI00294ADA08|nr:MFS transporter [Chromohalobacter sp. HP20-39]MDV6320459.1 MFS transporter [Chromohalobacter sp. HP20-39]